MSHSTSRRGVAGLAALAGLTAIGLLACMPPRDGSSLEPMGKLPGVVTTAVPEWVPFALFAGTPLPGDPRERRLSEPRRLDLGGDVSRVAWSHDGRSLLVQVLRTGSPCEEVVTIDLGREGDPRAVSAPGTRARLGASLGERGALVAEAPCAEPADRASWSIVHVGPSERRVVARPQGELIGLATDGRDVFSTVRDAAGKGRVERTPLDGGATLAVTSGTLPLGPPGLTPTRASLLVVKETPAGGTQVITLSDLGGDVRPFSRGVARDVDPVSLPDGSAVVFASTRASAPRPGGQASASDPAQLYLAHGDRPEAEGGPTAERVTFAGTDNRAPAVSPRGRTLAWISDRGASAGSRSVVVARFDGAP